MLTAAVRVYAGIKSNIGTIVVGNEGAGGISEEMSSGCGIVFLGRLVFGNIPECVETIGRVRNGAATLNENLIWLHCRAPAKESQMPSTEKVCLAHQIRSMILSEIPWRVKAGARDSRPKLTSWLPSLLRFLAFHLA